ncbi:MAG: DNA methyltransferase [Candidatus Sumerlaeia bacterium]|nr:DNA methyltransferase [Candidatus Sumerlaeia bacterium]
MAVHPVETYLRAMGEIRSTGGGRDETSYYAPLENLLNELGKGLKPRVRAVSQLQNLGDGSPDFGLFTANQFQRTDLEVLRGEHPERGVIEAKPVKDDSWLTAKGRQVSKYWRRYGHVLVTNYRDFLLIGRSRDGKAVRLESFRLVESEKDFWDLARHPRQLSRVLADRFADFLRRVMLYPAPISEPETLAHFLASHAREALARVEAADLPALAAVRTSLEESLGIKFEGDKGDHFFRSTLVQTLFYGVFSAWVLWAKDHPPTSDETFDWKTAVWTLRVPAISALFSQIATPTRLGPLHVEEVLNWTTGRLNAVDRAAFFQRFEEEHAVQYFYEPFLQAFDPDLRKRLGVWYTPPEIVQYMVARVDAVLREELKIPDGLAGPRVHILDPCFRGRGRAKSDGGLLASLRGAQRCSGGVRGEAGGQLRRSLRSMSNFSMRR